MLNYSTCLFESIRYLVLLIILQLVHVLIVGVVLFLGSPADRAGLRAGQVLLSVNGSNALDLSHQEIIQLIQKGQTPITHRLFMSTCIYPFYLLFLFVNQSEQVGMSQDMTFMTSILRIPYYMYQWRDHSL